MHQAFLAGAAVSRQSQRPGYSGNPVTFDATSLNSQDDASLQWNFGKNTPSVSSALRAQVINAASESSVDIPSIAAFSSLGEDGIVHPDIDVAGQSKGQYRGEGERGIIGGGVDKFMRNNNKSGGMAPPSSSKSDAMDVSWGLSSVGVGGGDLLNSAEMNDMSLSMLGLSIDGAEVAGKIGGSAVQNSSSVPRIVIPNSNTRSVNAVRGLPVMSPTAAMLAEISGEFKLGRITLEEKQRRKEAVLAASSRK